MFKKSLAILSLLFIVLGGGSLLQSQNIQDTTMHYYTIDGFERPGEWKVHYSKFRSKKWLKHEEKKDTTHEENKLWYDWFKADGTNFTKKEILPDFIVKNQNILTNELTVFGFRARWDFKGYNWIAIEPDNQQAEDAERYSKNKLGRYSDQRVSSDSLDDQEYQNYNDGSYILLPGKTKEISVYLWGSAFDYSLEYHVEDHTGKLYSINSGSINFKGWERITATIPNYVKQSSYYLPRAKPLKLKRIKLVLNPKERISGTYIYLDYLHGRTDTMFQSFFGEGLENSQRIWDKKQGKGGTTKK